ITQRPKERAPVDRTRANHTEPLWIRDDVGDPAGRTRPQCSALQPLHSPSLPATLARAMLAGGHEAARHGGCRLGIPVTAIVSHSSGRRALDERPGRLSWATAWFDCNLDAGPQIDLERRWAVGPAFMPVAGGRGTARAIGLEPPLRPRQSGPPA